MTRSFRIVYSDTNGFVVDEYSDICYGDYVWDEAEKSALKVVGSMDLQGINEAGCPKILASILSNDQLSINMPLVKLNEDIPNDIKHSLFKLVLETWKCACIENQIEDVHPSSFDKLHELISIAVFRYQPKFKEVELEMETYMKQVFTLKGWVPAIRPRVLNGYVIIKSLK